MNNKLQEDTREDIQKRIDKIIRSYQSDKEYKRIKSKEFNSKHFNGGGGGE
jgi:hypothetical protein